MAQDLASVRELHDAYAGPLYVYALRALGDRGAAEEIVQDTLVRAWKHADRYDADRASVTTWLFTIARNLVIDHRRRRSARPQSVAAVEEQDHSGDLGEPDVELDRALEAWQVAEALNRVAEHHREVIVKTYYEGLSVAETAERLGIPVGTVKSRLFYGLRSLRLLLEEMGVVT